MSSPSSFPRARRPSAKAHAPGQRQQQRVTDKAAGKSITCAGWIINHFHRISGGGQRVINGRAVLARIGVIVGAGVLVGLGVGVTVGFGVGVTTEEVVIVNTGLLVVASLVFIAKLLLPVEVTAIEMTLPAFEAIKDVRSMVLIPVVVAVKVFIIEPVAGRFL